MEKIFINDYWNVPIEVTDLDGAIKQVKANIGFAEEAEKDADTPHPKYFAHGTESVKIVEYWNDMLTKLTALKEGN